MSVRTQRGTATSLVLSCHPLPAAAMTVALTVAAALTGRSAPECLLVAATVLTGQLTIGWINDLVDADRDRASGRRDKPVAMGWIDPGTVSFATACAVLLVIPLSVANGTAAGIAHLAAVLSAWTYDFYFKGTRSPGCRTPSASGCCPRSSRTAAWAAGCTGRPRRSR